MVSKTPTRSMPRSLSSFAEATGTCPPVNINGLGPEANPPMAATVSTPSELFVPCCLSGQGIWGGTLDYGAFRDWGMLTERLGSHDFSTRQSCSMCGRGAVVASKCVGAIVYARGKVSMGCKCTRMYGCASQNARLSYPSKLLLES